MLVVAYLTCLFTSFICKLMATCLLSCYGLLVRIHSCFASIDMMIMYNCSNTCLYIL
jgi:hypothetical protein